MGVTEHIVRRFFDMAVLAALVASIVFISWKQQEIQAEVAEVQDGIDPASIVTIANRTSD